MRIEAQQNVLTFDKDAGDILQAMNGLVLKWKQKQASVDAMNCSGGWSPPGVA